MLFLSCLIVALAGAFSAGCARGPAEPPKAAGPAEPQDAKNGVPGPAKLPKPKDGPLGMKFVPLPKGTFYMCSDPRGYHEGMAPQKPSTNFTVIGEPFEIAIYTVTQGQWQELMGKNPSYFSRDGDGKDKVKDITDEDLKQFPVESVSWEDVQEFIKKLNEKEKGRGYLYRLPSEAEWDYACRGGATSEEECSYHFYFDKPTNDLSSKQANFRGEHPFGKGEKGPFLGRPTKVGSYAPNKLGLYDMHGNVWQWLPTVHPNASRLERMIRGGGWNHLGWQCRAGYYDWYDIHYRNKAFGFRLARVPDRQQARQASESERQRSP
jgi:formylglycine-generating enzyme required for sulfatase activity